jgi:threonine synthase
VRYVGTRGAAAPVRLSEAVDRGMAPGGGLYVPERLPGLVPADFAGAETLPEVAERLLAPFFAGDPLARDLPEICREALDFPVPLRRLREDVSVLELFHGPTAAFKDVGARFLAAMLGRQRGQDARTRTVLVATSGDTGGAVAAAFHGRAGTEVVILFPEGRVSARQEKQLTAWRGNVRALAVRGDFDDCQRLVKEAFADPELRASRRLTSANSINLGRLLPQTAYYAWTALVHARQGLPAPGFIVPSGNLGNATAALYARRCGLPVREVVLATNANRGLVDYLETGEWRARPTVATLATAMDVGVPSNLERLSHLLGGWSGMRRELRALAVDDHEIRNEIASGPARWGEVWDPHTASALAALGRLPPGEWVVVATAHPAKFEAVVEPLVGGRVDVPPQLAALLERPSRADPLAPDLGALKLALRD